mmetsp:Transcript_23223/g.37659  ORF Transcript_23223/g.37659 Transcript_23223/m.37659 type:complete len:218 (-) Transcript_23223:341-994(-)
MDEIGHEENYLDEGEFERALRLNAQLKALEAQFGGQPVLNELAPISEKRGGGHRAEKKASARQPTFSGPGQIMKRQEKDNYTFSQHELDEQEKNNYLLLKNLTHAEERRTKDRMLSNAPAALQYKKKSSSQINRNRNNDRIAQENAALFRRLQNTKSAVAPGMGGKKKPQQQRRAAAASGGHAGAGGGRGRGGGRRRGSGQQVEEEKPAWNERFSYT